MTGRRKKNENPKLSDKQKLPVWASADSDSLLLSGSNSPEIAEMQPVLLTVDDDPYLQEIVAGHAKKWGYIHRSALTAEQMWKQLDEITPSVILLDVCLSDADGAELVPDIRERFPTVPVIMITANATVDIAVKTLKYGAHDFLRKPLSFERLHIEIEKAVRMNRLSMKVRAFESASLQNDFHGMVGSSEPMRQIYHLIDTVAPTDATVLILGPTGTGKELVARAIHQCSRCSSGPFIPVNAPAIPHELIESALFGHEKGAYTGADKKHIGYCEQADGGTLFLDEICEMDYEVQAKLLRFLQDHVVQPVGAKSRRAVQVRVIAATNRRPQEQIQQHKLRRDFFYRLSTITIQLPPLNQRNGDIERLSLYFLDLARAKYAAKMSKISPEAMHSLKEYDWPGNVRQLENIINQIVITNNDSELTPEMLPKEITTASLGKCSRQIRAEDNGTLDYLPSIAQMEEDLILRALGLFSGSVPDAAKHLGLSEATLYRKIKKMGLKRSFAEK